MTEFLKIQQCCVKQNYGQMVRVGDGEMTINVMHYDSPSYRKNRTISDRLGFSPREQ
jgi:hypothetical protein